MNKNKCIALLSVALALAVFFGIRFYSQAQEVSDRYERAEYAASSSLRNYIITTCDHLELMHDGVVAVISGERASGSLDSYVSSTLNYLNVLENKLLRQVEIAKVLEFEAYNWNPATFDWFASALHTIDRSLSGFSRGQEYADVEDELLDLKEFLEVTMEIYSPAAEALASADDVGAVTEAYAAVATEMSFASPYYNDLTHFFGDREN